MSALPGLAWIVVAPIAVLVGYAAVSAGVLLFVRLPDDAPWAILEDLVFLATLPFAVGVLAASIFRRERGR